MNRLAKRIYEENKKKGFWSEDVKERNFGEIIALCHSELSEALEADRGGKAAKLDVFDFCTEQAGMNSKEEFKSVFEKSIKDTKEDELADAIIRILDYCGAMQIDIERHIELKLSYNKTRAAKHGKSY